MALGENAADHQSSSYKISMSGIRRSLRPCTRRISLNRHARFNHPLRLSLREWAGTNDVWRTWRIIFRGIGIFI